MIFRAEPQFNVFTGMESCIGACTAFLPESQSSASGIGKVITRTPACAFSGEFAMYGSFAVQHGLFVFRRAYLVQIVYLRWRQAFAVNGGITPQITPGWCGRCKSGLLERGAYRFTPTGVLSASVQFLKFPAGFGSAFRGSCTRFLQRGSGSGMPRRRPKKYTGANQHAKRNSAHFPGTEGILNAMHKSIIAYSGALRQNILQRVA